METEKIVDDDLLSAYAVVLSRGIMGGFDEANEDHQQHKQYHSDSGMTFNDIISRTECIHWRVL